AGFEGDRETFDLLEKVDERTASGVAIEESFALAALYLSRFRRACPSDGEHTVTDAVRIAGLVLAPHSNYFHVAHGIRHQARELLVGIFRLLRGPGQRGERRFLQHPATPRSLELFTLWAGVSGEGADLLDPWQKALARAAEPQAAPSQKPKTLRTRRGGRRRGRGGRRPPPSTKS
ncbi:MAG: CCA tRNA nucleotidyltransferase, partial [Desulfuromonadales bacterium]